jgi:D-amino peptidase
MKVYIMADLEGATAVTGGWDETNPGRREFEHARKMVTGDINACAKGAFEAGASDIVAFDGHGMAMSVDTLGIDPNVRLIRGRAIFSAGLIPGLDSTFDAMIILGMHAMEGTRDGVMNSTFVGNMRTWINGKEVGETGLFSAIAAEMGVPTILVTGDEAVAREAKDLIPDIYTVAVKKGLSRYSAEIIQPAKAWAMIRQTTREAVENYKKVSLYKPAPPVELRVEYAGNTQLVDCVAQVPGVVRVNGSTISYTSATVSEGLRAVTHLASWMLGDHPIL